MACKHDPRERFEINGGYIDEENRVYIHMKCGICDEEWFEEWQDPPEGVKDYYRKLRKEKKAETGEITYDLEVKASMEIILPTGNIKIPKMKIIVPISYQTPEEAKMLEQTIKAALEKAGLKINEIWRNQLPTIEKPGSQPARDESVHE